ncbi:MAG: dihydrodipicolinate synthase family protein [Propioniciclava sp.]
MPPTAEVLAALTTPFTADGGVDIAGFRANVERLEPEVDGVFVGGTTGEFPALSVAEFVALLTEALDVFGPSRVVAHVGSASTHQSLLLTAEATSLGSERFACITPYYLPASLAGLTRHWGMIKDACSGDLYGYLYPDVAGTDLLPADLPAALASGIDGIKVSGAASARVGNYLAHAPDGFTLWSGNDADLPAVLAAGGRGTVSGCAGACPGPWAAFRAAYASENRDALTAAQASIEAVVAVLGPSIANLKHALDLQGLPGGLCRMSIDAPGPQIRPVIADVVARP